MIILDRRKYAPEGADGGTGGSTSENPNPTENPSEGSSDGSGSKGSGKSEFVKREILDTYKSDLAKWKKKARENEDRLSAIDAEKASHEEQKLLEEKKYQELLEKRDAEIAELKGQHSDYESKLDSYKNREITGEKLSAFMDKADFKIDSKYLSFVDIDSIEIDETGNVVASSVTDAVDKFRKEHPSLILGKGRSPSHHQPGNEASSKLTQREFDELYRRDQAAAYKAVYDGRVIDS